MTVNVSTTADTITKNCHMTIGLEETKTGRNFNLPGLKFLPPQQTLKAEITGCECDLNDTCKPSTYFELWMHFETQKSFELKRIMLNFLKKQDFQCTHRGAGS